MMVSLICVGLILIFRYEGIVFFPFFAVTFVEDLCLLWLVKPLQYVTLSSFTRFLDIGSLYLNVSFVFIRGV